MKPQTSLLNPCKYGNFVKEERIREDSQSVTECHRLKLRHLSFAMDSKSDQMLRHSGESRNPVRRFNFSDSWTSASAGMTCLRGLAAREFS